MFWHGAPLSRLERLALGSFVHHGHPVELYLYEPQAGIPAGVSVRDAEEVLPASAMFRHRKTGSLAPFADWFRYRLLLERGGIWADMDVVCLAPFDFKDDVFYGWESPTRINNAVLGLPAGHVLAEWLAAACESPHSAWPFDDARTRARKWIRRHLQGDQRGNVRWGEYGPKGLTRAVHHFGLDRHALPTTVFYPVPPEEWRQLFEPVGDDVALWSRATRAVHFWNHQHARAGEAALRDDGQGNTPFERLCRRYGV